MAAEGQPISPTLRGEAELGGFGGGAALPRIQGGVGGRSLPTLRRIRQNQGRLKSNADRKESKGKDKMAQDIVKQYEESSDWVDRDIVKQ